MCLFKFIFDKTKMNKFELIQAFKYKTKQNQKNNWEIRDKPSNVVRIVSYNVHYWGNVDGCPNFRGIWSDICDIDADVLCLQEVSFERTRFNPYTYDELIKMLTDIGYMDFIEVYGSNYMASASGNLIASKYPFVSKSSHSLPVGRSKIRCGYCVGVFDKFRICCLQLDTFDKCEDIRKTQLTSMVKSLCDRNMDYTIICGDFNSIDLRDYDEQYIKHISMIDKERSVVTDNGTETIKILTKLAYTSLPSQSINEKMTVWTGRIVDYIFTQQCVDIVKYGAYYTINSTHYPIFIDILKHDFW